MERLEELLVGLYPRDRGPFELVLVDVGSMGGLEDEWRSLGPNLTVIGFEPDRREFECLTQAAAERHLPVVVLDRSRDATLHISRDPGKSSVFRPNLELLRRFPRADRFDVVAEQPVAAAEVTTLDAALASLDIGDADFLKIDTQGSELLVLRGGLQALSQVVAVKVEVEFLELYEGQPLFADVDALLRAHGFTLMDLDRVFWKRSVYPDYQGKGQLVFADALYFREPGDVLDDPGSPERVFDKAFRLAVTAATYGIHDLAMAAVEAYRERGLPHAAALGALATQIEAWDVSQGGWAQRDGMLGNRPNRS